jgi:hypothetical protein
MPACLELEPLPPTTGFCKCLLSSVSTPDIAVSQHNTDHAPVRHQGVGPPRVLSQRHHSLRSRVRDTDHQHSQFLRAGVWGRDTWVPFWKPRASLWVVGGGVGFRFRSSLPPWRIYLCACVFQVEVSDRTPLLSLLLVGDAGSGKTAIAAKVSVKQRSSVVHAGRPRVLHVSIYCLRCLWIDRQAWDYVHHC